MSDRAYSLSRRTFLAGAGSTGAVALAGCTQSGTGGGDGGDDSLSGTVDVSGSSTVFPLAIEIRSRFLEQHPDVSINVSPTGTGGGFQNRFCPGETDLNNASRPIQPAEQELCSQNGVTPVEFRVATDALTVIVNPAADWLDCVTIDELAEIWSADSPPSMWSDVNDEWPDEPLNLFGPTDASGTFDYFHEAVLGEGTDHRRDYQATEQDRQIVQGVQDDEYALGYLGYAYYSSNKDTVKALGIDAGDGCIQPALETAKSGNYPLSRPLFTYAARSSLTENQVAEFVRFWLQNSTSQDIVADAVGYVPNDEATKSTMLDRLDEAIEAASG